MAGGSGKSDMRGMWIALGGYSVLFLGKLAAFLLTHLGVMFAEAMHSMADMLITAFLLVAAWMSARPADEEFRFGYGRAQNIAALVAATIFISFTSFETLREAIPKLFQPPEGAHTGIPVAIGVILVSLVISSLPIIAIARQKERGAASKAQLMEGINDEIALVAALGGIIFVAYGVSWADPAASIVVALVIAFNAVTLWRENAATLMGASPEPAFYDKIREISFAVTGVKQVHNIIAEQVGEQIHLGMHIEVARGITIEAADKIADETHDAICAAFDDIWVVVHADPENSGDAGNASSHATLPDEPALAPKTT